MSSIKPANAEQLNALTETRGIMKRAIKRPCIKCMTTGQGQGQGAGGRGRGRGRVPYLRTSQVSRRFCHLPENTFSKNAHSQKHVETEPVRREPLIS